MAIKKVLIVDDDPAMLDVLKMIFERMGYGTAVLADGNAILSNTYERPDIFILDKQLSGVDGLDICRHLKKKADTAKIPVIILSATPHAAQLAVDAGADDFLEKPFKNRELLDMVVKHVGVAQRFGE